MPSVVLSFLCFDHFGICALFHWTCLRSLPYCAGWVLCPPHCSKLEHSTDLCWDFVCSHTVVESCSFRTSRWRSLWTCSDDTSQTGESTLPVLWIFSAEQEVENEGAGEVSKGALQHLVCRIRSANCFEEIRATMLSRCVSSNLCSPMFSTTDLNYGGSCVGASVRSDPPRKS